MLNTPQENRKLAIITELKDINNYIDSIDLKVTIDQLEKDIEPLYIKSYVVFSIEVIGSRSTEYKEQIERIEKNLREIDEYSSLLNATKADNKKAIEYFNKEMESGGAVRIM